MTEETYTIGCHVDECEKEFIDVTKDVYVEHLLSDHAIQTADKVVEMMINELESEEQTSHIDHDELHADVYEQAKSLDNTTFIAIPGNEVAEKPTDEPNPKLDSIIVQHNEFEAIDGNDAAENLGITLTEFREIVEDDPRFEFGVSPRFPWVNLESYRRWYDHGEEGYREYYE